MSAQRMSNADAAWLHMDRPTNLMVVNALMWFDEPLDVERAREVVRTRLVERFPATRSVDLGRRVPVLSAVVVLIAGALICGQGCRRNLWIGSRTANS